MIEQQSVIPSSQMLIESWKILSQFVIDEDNSTRHNNETTVSIEQNALRYTTGVSSILSIFGSSFIIFSTLLFTILSWRKHKKKSRKRNNYRMTAMNHRLVFYLSVSDLLASFSYLISLFGLSLEYEWCCFLQGFLMTCFEMSSVFWSTCICLQLFLSVTPHFSEEKHRRRKIILEVIFHLICWIVPLLYTVTVSLTQKFARIDNLQQWCWIGLGHDHSQFLNFRFFTFLIVYICVSMCAVFFLGVCICFRIHRRKSNRYEVLSLSDRYQQLGKRTILNFSLIMIAFFITWIPAFINRLVESIIIAQSPTSATMISGIFWLDLLQAITNPLQGFLNMILYGHHFFSKYKSYCCSKKRVKKVNSKSSLLGGGESSETPLKQKSPDFSDKNLNEDEEIKFGVIYTERPKIVLDSPSADNIVPKSVYYYHLDNHYDDDECSEEESAHYDNVPRTFLPNYFNNETPLYSSVASSGGNQHGMRIIHQTEASSILSGPYFQNNGLRGNNNNGNSYRNSGAHDSLRQESIRMIPIAQSNSISGAYNTSVEYNARLDDILD